MFLFWSSYWSLPSWKQAIRPQSVDWFDSCWLDMGQHSVRKDAFFHLFPTPSFSFFLFFVQDMWCLATSYCSSSLIRSSPFFFHLRKIALFCLIGSVLANISPSPSLSISDLSYNHLSGTLPPSLQDDNASVLLELEVDLSHNDLACPLPNWCSAPPTGNGACSPCWTDDDGGDGGDGGGVTRLHKILISVLVLSIILLGIVAILAIAIFKGIRLYMGRGHRKVGTARYSSLQHSNNKRGQSFELGEPIQNNDIEEEIS